MHTIKIAIDELDILKDTPPMNDSGEGGTPTPKEDPEEWKRRIEELMAILKVCKISRFFVHKFQWYISI